MQTPMVHMVLPSDYRGELREALKRIQWLCTDPWERYFTELGNARQVIQVTHTDRTAGFPAGSALLGQLLWETDRKILYMAAVVGNVQAWVYVAGEYRALLASLPSDLVASDVGFLFYASNYRHTLRWGGAGWEMQEEGRGYLSLHLRNPFTHTGVVDTSSTGNTVTWNSGPKFDSGWGTNNRIWINGVWYVIASYTSSTVLVLTTSPGNQTDVVYAIAVGWHFCDGNGDANTLGGNIAVMKYDGTTENITVADLSGLFPKLGAVNASTVFTAGAGVAPTISGATASDGAHTHEVPSHGHTANTTDVQSGAGATVATGVQDKAPFNTVSSGAHTHAFGTLVVSNTGQPVNIVVPAWLRK